MNKGEKVTLIEYRLERANESIKAAELMFDNGFYFSAMNRIYFPMFYSIHALVILNEMSFSKHGQVKGYFNKEFINGGIFPKDVGMLFNTVFEYRHKFDYMDLVMPEKELISFYILEAKKFIKTISDYITSINEKNE